MKFIPGAVTPEQLEEYRQKYDAAREHEGRAFEYYEAAYHVYCVAVHERRLAEELCVWAEQGMVLEVTE